MKAWYGNSRTARDAIVVKEERGQREQWEMEHHAAFSRGLDCLASPRPLVFHQSRGQTETHPEREVFEQIPIDRLIPGSGYFMKAAFRVIHDEP